ncbi:MAG: RagB/SusD family nutrient uptake outer membrane protein [Prevotella sp.]
MKRTIICACLAATLTTSCNLDYAPENTLVDEKVYNNQKTAEAALLGAYVRLNVFYAGAPQDQNNYSNSGYTIQMGDMTTENVAVRSTATGYLAVQKSEYTSSEHDGLLASMWRWGYNCIDYANNIINKIEEYGTFDEKMRRQYIAEAKFIRAYVNFYLLCLYGDQAMLGNDNGDGIVIRTDAYNGYNPDDVVARSSNAECWSHILKDLDEALPDLPDEVPAITDRVRANKTVVKALLSRIYLYRGTYTNNQADIKAAMDYAKEVIGTNGYGFSTSSDEYSTALFPCNEYSQSGSYPDPTTRSNELIFFQASRIYTDNYPNGQYWYRKLSYYVPEAMALNYEEDDVRRTYLIWTGSVADYKNDKTTMKYSGGYYDDVLYIRMAEMKLTYAETLARTSNSVTNEAVGHLNDVHQRAYPVGKKPAQYKVGDFANVEAFLKEVLRERNRELAYEGHYRWDLMRTKNLLGDTVLGAIKEARWNMPVPEYEIRISNGSIKQNSGY